MENEIWKDVKGFENLYQVSNLGRVKSLTRYISKQNNITQLVKERILKLANNGKGYLFIDLYKNGVKQRFQIHRLVAMTFLDNPNNYPQVNHKDENPQNNIVTNLEWCTQKYNSNFGTLKQRIANKLKNKFNTSLSKRVYQYSWNGELVNIYNSTMECKRNGYNQSNVASCCRGERKSHKGYIWKYEN